jgi:glutamate dehydrogenase (NAD(P)+)
VREVLQDSETVEKLNMSSDLNGKTVVIQGFGNVGYWAAHFFHESGAKIVGIGEYNGAIHNPQGETG